jgi:hypothetical protein
MVANGLGGPDSGAREPTGEPLRGKKGGAPGTERKGLADGAYGSLAGHGTTVTRAPSKRIPARMHMSVRSFGFAL